MHVIYQLHNVKIHNLYKSKNDFSTNLTIPIVKFQILKQKFNKFL